MRRCLHITADSGQFLGRVGFFRESGLFKGAVGRKSWITWIDKTLKGQQCSGVLIVPWEQLVYSVRNITCVHVCACVWVCVHVCAWSLEGFSKSWDRRRGTFHSLQCRFHLDSITLLHVSRAFYCVFYRSFLCDHHLFSCYLERKVWQSRREVGKGAALCESVRDGDTQGKGRVKQAQRDSESEEDRRGVNVFQCTRSEVENQP